VGSTLPISAAQKILLTSLRGCGRTPRQARFAKFSHQQKKRPSN
jgi:signal recognition particle GTPase